MTDIHDNVTESSKLCATEWLGEEISNHFISWTVFKYDLHALAHIRNEIVSDVHMASTLAA